MATTSTRRRARRAAGRGEPFPQAVAPMLATHGSLPGDPAAWAFEYKWDGVRAIVYWDGATLRIDSRNGRDVTATYPELAALGAALGERRAVLDGEIVAMDAEGRVSFSLLQERMHVQRPTGALVRRVPAWLVLFDVLWLDGASMVDRPYRERRAALEELTLKGPSWGVTPSVVGEGEAMLSAATVGAIEGIVAKRLEGAYEPGRRSREWVKIKVVGRQEFVVGGWRPQVGEDRRVGSLVIGYYDCAGKLRHAGGIGTGFSDEEQRRLVPMLDVCAAAKSVFADAVPRPGEVRWVEPVLVAEVEYRRWPAGGMVQQGSYKGIRVDKDAREVVKERP